jgi:hypothetical protein
MRRACRQIEQAVSAVALVKRGERSTSSRSHLYVREGLGAGLCSIYDVYLSAMLSGQVAAARCGGVEEKGMRGALAAYATDRGTTLAWGRRRVLSALGSSGDATVPERGHVSLSEVGLVAVPSDLSPRWEHVDFDAARDHHTDGGRWADWRIMDLLPERVVEDTWRWCGKVGLRWVGQLMMRDGRSLLSRRGWLRLLGVHDAPRAAVTIHEAMEAELRGGGWLVSPLAVRGLDDFKALRTGQFALVSCKHPENTFEVVPGYRLVQGVDASGGVGGTWQPGGTAFVGGCAMCALDACPRDAHAPARVRWSTATGEWMVRVRELQYWELDDVEGNPSTGIYAPESWELLWLPLPSLFHALVPSVVHHDDGSVGLLPVVPAAHMSG